MGIDLNRAGPNNPPPRDLTRLALPLVMVFCGLMIFLLGWALLANRYGWTGFFSSLLGLTMLGAGTVLLMVRGKALTLRLAMILPLLAVANVMALVIAIHFPPSWLERMWWRVEPIDLFVIISAFPSFSIGMYWFSKKVGLNKVAGLWAIAAASTVFVVELFVLGAGPEPVIGPVFIALAVLLSFFCVGLLRTARVLREADQQLKEGKA